MPSRVREAIFSMLRECIAGARVLDLFAGSGVMGLESVSRGAAGATFVDISRTASTFIEGNIHACRVMSVCDIIRADFRNALPLLRRRGLVFDLVFVDPPFDKPILEPAMILLLDHGLLSGKARIVVKHKAHSRVGLGNLRIESLKRYGSVSVTIFAMKG